MNYHQFPKKEFSNINQYMQKYPSQPMNIYNQNNYNNLAYQQNYNQTKPSNNLIDSDFNYQQNFSPPGTSGSNRLYPQKNNFINDKDNRNINKDNNYPKNNLIYQDYIPPSQNKYNISNNNLIDYDGNKPTSLITRDKLNEKEIEMKRKKQMKYNEELNRQVEEKKKKKELEKKKKLEEDLKLEKKIQRQILEEQKELELKKQQQLLKQRQEEELSQYQNKEINNNNNQTHSSGFNNTGNTFYSQDTNQFNSNNTQQYNPPPQSGISTERSNISSNTNFNRNNIKNYYMNFVEEQLGIIDEYEEKINNYNNSSSNYENIINERDEALKQLETSQNNFKNNYGMLPMNEQFNKKVANIMDFILEQKVKDIKNNNYSNNNISSINNSQIKDNLLEKSQRSTATLNLDKNAISNPQNINNDIIVCGYKSKYEELKESIRNGDDISAELKTSISLIGDSKFVIQNKFVGFNENNNNINFNQNLSELYTTWNEQNFNNNNNNINNTIKNNNDNEEFKIEEINNNDEPSNNNINNQNVILGDSSEDIPINNNKKSNQISNNKNNNNDNINNLNIDEKDINVKDSYMDKVNEALHKTSQKISKQEKNKSIFLLEENNDNTNNNTNINNNLNVNNSTDDFLNVEKIEYPNYNTKESQEYTKSLNNNSNINSFQNYTSINPQIKNYNLNKTNESDENVVIGNISLNTTIKNSVNTNFNNTGKTNTLAKEMKLNEVEEKEEEELYESEFKEEAKNELKNIEEEENYENEFENEDPNEIKKLEEQEKSEKNKVNLDDYKEIHESQRIQTQLNFFEDSIMDNINIHKSRGHIVGNIKNKESENLGEDNKNDRNVLMSSELKDSYGDNILKNLNKYRKMALGESSMSQNEWQ